MQGNLYYKGIFREYYFCKKHIEHLLFTYIYLLRTKDRILAIQSYLLPKDKSIC